MATSWMQAAEQEGIPTAFIVNKDGKVAWIGHPMEMDKPLEKIVAGTWDLRTAAEEQQQAKERQAKLQRLQSKLNQAQRSGDPKKLLAAVDEIIGEMPELELRLGLLLKLPTLIKMDQQDKALDLAKQLEKTPIGKDPRGLDHLARTLIDPSSGIKPNAKLVQFALDLGRRADEQSNGKNGSIAETLAKAYFDSGDAAKAVETQERAIRLAKESGQVPEPLINQMKNRLEEYKRPAKK
jgi:tetratricopeptide (TPR) repeat protein